MLTALGGWSDSQPMQEIRLRDCCSAGACQPYSKDEQNEDIA
jgi:hypothetical protein